MDNGELMFNWRSLWFTGKEGEKIKGVQLAFDDEKYIETLVDYNS